ncbi:hypothetical protein SLEP1_g28162 [Rubroshorea leprosula]|uniref:Uncharacterized protein n=1 Tax=Rubroshorea leprosula TaxID=152421 RepID=A0AAV5JSR7_9ROSI|nr:hypothetical protein SLEP1_g28162 [Rubroshorea leprosula]
MSAGFRWHPDLLGFTGTQLAGFQKEQLGKEAILSGFSFVWLENGIVWVFGCRENALNLGVWMLRKCFEFGCLDAEKML